MTETKLDRPTFILNTKSLREILSDLRKAEVWLKIAALAAFLASAFFVVKYFVGGDMTPALWTKEQWANALLGLGITAVITSAQAFLYASGYKGHAAVIATFIVVFFGLFSEISQSMEREDASVRHRSENSAVFRATLGSIQQLSVAPTLSSVATSELARAQQEAASIQTRIDNKNRCKSCETESFRNLRADLADAKGRVAAAQARVDAETQATSTANAAALQQAISTAKVLEYDEDKHYAMIRLLQQLFGVNGIWASFLFSIIIIGTFEYAFHFVGAYVADHKRALLMLGRDAQGKRIHPYTDEEPNPPGTKNSIPKNHPHNDDSTHTSPSTGAGDVSPRPSAQVYVLNPKPNKHNQPLAFDGNIAMHTTAPSQILGTPADEALNRTANKADIQRIIKRGQKASSDHPEATPQNRPTPHPNAHPNGLAGHSDGHPDDGKTATELLTDPNNFGLLKSYVEHPKFNPIFIAVATGSIPCSQNKIKSFGVGGDMPKWVLVIMEGFGIVTEPKANGQRQLVRQLSAQEAAQELKDVRDIILNQPE